MIPFIDHMVLCSSYTAHPAHLRFLLQTLLSRTTFSTLLRSWNYDLLCYIYRRPSVPNHDNTWQIGVAWHYVFARGILFADDQLCSVFVAGICVCRERALEVAFCHLLAIYDV